MKALHFPCILFLAILAHAAPHESPPILLDEMSIRNLGIRTKEAEEGVFERTVLALGEIRHTCASHGVVASRIPGRIIAVLAHQGDLVRKGDVVARIESRQPGNPPPSIDLLATQSGLVAESDAHLGAPVEPSEELMVIHDLSTVWAVAKVPQHEAPLLNKGKLARIRIPALGKESLSARFLRLGTQADPVKGYIEAVFQLPNPGNRMRPGMRAEIQIIADRRDAVTSVPRESVQGEGGDRFVFVRDYELPSAFVRVPVVTGATNDRHVEILGGLMPGDEVVVDGAYELIFAGSGNQSLKEALDAAHGHSHHEDGSEMTAEPGGSTPHHDEGHDHDPEDQQREHTPYTVIACGILLALLIASQIALHNARKGKN